VRKIHPVPAEHQIVEHTCAVEELDVLKGPRNAGMNDFVAPQGKHVATHHAHRPR
jgi:hypothetical protein